MSSVHKITVSRIAGSFVLLASFVGWQMSTAEAKDYFLTIGGGYAPHGNQASMEANVLFFHSLVESREGDKPFEHRIFFADGSDPEADVQTASHPGGETVVRSLLGSLFDWKFDQVEYRDHDIPNIAGSNQPDEIRLGFEEVVKSLTSDDRFFVYVTAHGGPAKTKNDFDTKIHCWNRSSIRASEFADWLDEVPQDVPVIMVMAQCYCGGYAHTIFSGGKEERGLAAGLRCGFFAQQHNLPAAGCRPDISNDREYSSYFWGAICGQSRNGQPIVDVDRDGDGQVSFAEAHIYAVLVGETIDIPLRCSDALLRSFSRTKPNKDESQQADGKDAEATDANDENNVAAAPAAAEFAAVELVTASGSLGDLVAIADFVNAEIVRGLATQLGLSLDTPVAEIEQQLKRSQRERRLNRRRGGADRRRFRELEGELRDAIVEHWPEIEKVEKLQELAGVGLSLDDLEQEIPNWELFKDFAERFADQTERKAESNRSELEQVQLKRLLQSVESIALANNLPIFADPAVVQRYQQMLALERTNL
ncbi:hypothetical protein SH139x_003706 [Planctomycetaceae bacterium SH139]